MLITEPTTGIASSIRPTLAGTSSAKRMFQLQMPILMAPPGPLMSFLMQHFIRKMTTPALSEVWASEWARCGIQPTSHQPLHQAVKELPRQSLRINLCQRLLAAIQMALRKPSLRLRHGTAAAAAAATVAMSVAMCLHHSHLSRCRLAPGVLGLVAYLLCQDRNNKCLTAAAAAAAVAAFLLPRTALFHQIPPHPPNSYHCPHRTRHYITPPPSMAIDQKQQHQQRQHPQSLLVLPHQHSEQLLQ